MPKTDEELFNIATLWYKIGYRDKVVINNEIKCNGCTIKNFCRYNIIDCTQKHSVQNCGECSEYPCSKIIKAFEKTMLFEPKCKEVCTEQEYEIMSKAFFCKKHNLDRVKNKFNI